MLSLRLRQKNHQEKSHFIHETVIISLFASHRLYEEEHLMLECKITPKTKHQQQIQHAFRVHHRHHHSLPHHLLVKDQKWGIVKRDICSSHQQNASTLTN